jgi:FKBP-type peptidyl-prolyl cis-trans isomerase SlyD
VAAEIVETGKVVLFNYTLTDDDGDVIDSSEGDPMPYLHGFGNIVPGLESQMTGKAVGASFTAHVPPEEGYGMPQGIPTQAVPIDQFPPDMDIEPGMQFAVGTSDGGHMPVWVDDVSDTEVTISFDHPLAGKTLHFAIEITGLRDASAEELDHGHPHGPTGAEGHHHGH